MICANPDCRNDAPDGIIKEFAIGISVSDHTTTLDHITLNGRVLDKCLNGQYFHTPVRASSFEVYSNKTQLESTFSVISNLKLDLLDMSVDELTVIKWKLLLERCEILLKVSQP